MELFDRFVQERVYLKGISPATVRYYGNVRTAFLPILPEPTKTGMIDSIQKLLANGTSPISVNTYLRGLKAYIIWLHSEGHLKEVVKVQFLKTEQKILSTLSADSISALLRYKAVGTNLNRAHVVALTILDTGLRASEVLGLTKEDVNFENLVFKVIGKGGKHRLIPLSEQLRKFIFRHTSRKQTGNFIFGTKNNTKLSVRNLERDLKVLGQKVGIAGVRFSPHTLRHTFAVSYLRNGGNLEYLRKILGHSNISTTQKYLRSLGIEDLSNVHNSLSPLSQVHRSVR